MCLFSWDLITLIMIWVKLHPAEGTLSAVQRVSGMSSSEAWKRLGSGSNIPCLSEALVFQIGWGRNLSVPECSLFNCGKRRWNWLSSEVHFRFYIAPAPRNGPELIKWPCLPEAWGTQAACKEQLWSVVHRTFALGPLGRGFQGVCVSYC